MPAIIKCDNAPAGPREHCHPAGLHPVGLLGGCEAVDQRDRLAFALVEISDLDGAVGEICHAGCLAAGERGGNWLDLTASELLLAMSKKTQSRPFCGRLECRYKSEKRKQGTQKP